MKKTNSISLHKWLIYNALVVVIFSIVSQRAFGKSIDKPWLQGLDANNMYVLVESDSDDKITLYYSLANNPRNEVQKTETKFTRRTNYGARTYVHRFLLQNLEIGAEYNYWFDSKEKYSFTIPQTEGELNIVNMGDNRSGIKYWNKIITNMGDENPDFMIFNGDLAYKKEYNYWIDEFFTEPAQKVFTKYPFYNAIGNHEKWNDNSQAFLQSPAISKEPQSFYSFERGEAFFLVLNTELAVGTNSQQWKFAEEQLRSTKKKWKIVVFHIPAYSSGAHGENKNMKRMTEKIFEKHGVDLILTGHSHFYQHNLVNGIHHMVIGSGGSPLYTPKEADYTVSQAKKYHYAVINITNERIKFIVKGLDKEIIDEFEIR